MSAQLDYGQLLKPLFAVVYLESKILSRDVSVCIFHDLSISSLFVGFQPTNTDKTRQQLAICMRSLSKGFRILLINIGSLNRKNIEFQFCFQYARKKNWFWNFSPIIPNSLPKQTCFGIVFGSVAN